MFFKFFLKNFQTKLPKDDIILVINLTIFPIINALCTFTIHFLIPFHSIIILKVKPPHFSKAIKIHSILFRLKHLTNTSQRAIYDQL